MRFLRSLFFIAALILFVPASGYCQDLSDSQAVKTLEGEVSEIDSVGGTMAVRWMGWDDGIGYHKMALTVSPDARISKDAETIGLMDINQFDWVIIRYVDDDKQGPTAINIVVDNNI